MIELKEKEVAVVPRDADIRKKILGVEATIRNMPGSLGEDPFPLKHTFADGMYVREISVPRGFLVVTKIHKLDHPCFVLKGDCSVLTEEGVKRIKAPYHMITKAGTKRIVYVHEDTVWVTVHKTDHKDLEKIEEEIIAKTFDDLNIIDVEIQEFLTEVTFDIEKLRELTKKVILHEKHGFYSDWTKEQQELYDSGKWEAFSRSRGYSKEEISDFRLWISMKEDAEKRGLKPLEMIKDLSLEASLKNIQSDKKGEILLSSHIPSNKKGDKL